MKVLLKGQVRFMKQNGFETTMISSNGAEVPALKEQEGALHIIVPFTRSISPFKDLFCLIKLTRILKKLKPDIVHTHTPKAGLIGMWAAWLSRVPVRLHTIAGLPWMETKGLMKTLLKNVERLTAWPAQQVYPNSYVQQRYLQQEKIANGKLKVLGNGSSNGIDLHHFALSDSIKQEAAELRAAENVKPEDWIWIFIGRIVNDKGIRELLEAFQKIHAAFPGDRLWLLGTEEPELDPLDEYHKKILHEHPGIRAWGFINDVRPFLAASQVLAFPSYREGFPNVPLQAGLMGCALILSDINGCNEIVDNNKNGILIEPKNADALFAAMNDLRLNPATRTEYSRSISEKISGNYDQQKLWNTILAEYKSMLEKKGTYSK
jgi:glycosyltransferase involved in cell wall biosynthesis